MKPEDELTYFLELNITFFVDDIKLEDEKRGERVKSQIYQEIFRHFKNSYLNWDGMKEKESEEVIAKVRP